VKEPLMLFASRTAGAVGLVGSVFLICDCTSSKQQLGFVEDPTPAILTAPDAGSNDDAASQEGLVSYCPSSECPPGWTTCPDSRFPCDTNVLVDSKNCGACGNACQTSTGYEQFTCSDGACKMECLGHPLREKDCDGLVENGCESRQIDPNNCGACGVVCPDGTRCLYQEGSSGEVGCGCPPGKLDCGSLGCVEIEANDNDCGACDNSCDRTGGSGAQQYTNAHYGCLDRQCGKVKCSPRFADCDGTIDNGCETSTYTDDDCGACGNKCPAGQKCIFYPITQQPTCMCEEGLTFCQTGEKDGLPMGICADINSDPSNCGGCGVECGWLGVSLQEKRVCDFGKCVLRCVEGWANCNGAQSDGCEIDTNSDPRNCGGCGITCDLKLGQACVAGKCVVEPCDQTDAGEVTR